MVRHTDIEMIVMKEEVYAHRSLEEEAKHARQGHMEDAPGSGRKQKRKGENVIQSPYWGFHRREWVRQGRCVEYAWY